MYTGVDTTGVFQVTIGDVINAGGNDFYPTASSLLIGAGSVNYSPRLTYDFNGKSRSATAPTVGAYVRHHFACMATSLMFWFWVADERGNAGALHGDQPWRGGDGRLQVGRLVQQQAAHRWRFEPLQRQHAHLVARPRPRSLIQPTQGRNHNKALCVPLATSPCCPPKRHKKKRKMSWKTAVMFFSERGEEGKENSTICAFCGRGSLGSFKFNSAPGQMGGSLIACKGGCTPFKVLRTGATPRRKFMLSTF